MGARPVRVLIVGPSFDILGGQALQAALLVEYLGGEPSAEVSFLAFNPRLPRPLRSVRYLRTLLKSVIYVGRLAARVPRHDVVVASSAAYSAFLVGPTPAIVVAKLCRKAAVLHYHSGEADLHLRRWRRTAPATMRLVDAIVVPSKYLVTQFESHGLRPLLIRNVLDVSRLSFRERRPLRPVLLSSRQLISHSNVSCVLRAFALVQRGHPEARLLVAADGEERPRLEALTRELGLRSVEFLGWLPHDRVDELYGSADVYLNASDARDNIPMSILEAFATGLPVVSSDVSGVAELVRPGETGLLVPFDDHSEMAAAVMRLLNDAELASTIIRAARSECSRFAWSEVREPWLALVRELAAQPEG